MSIEEKAKAYDEALETARQIHNGNPSSGTAIVVCEQIFPELRESEDERMVREFNDWLCEEIECRTNDLRDEKDRRTLNMLCYVLTKVKDWLEQKKKPSVSFNPALGFDPGSAVVYHNDESEEETTRKELLDFVRSFWADHKEKLPQASRWVTYLEKQQEIPMPNSTELIEMWDKEEAMLKEKDFRGDTWRIAYNAFLDGFAQGIMVKQKEQKKDNPLEDFSKGYNAGYYHGRTDKEQKPELVQHPPITYTYPSDASRDEQLKMALLALLNSDLIKVAGNKFTKQDLIDWVEQKPELYDMGRWDEESYNNGILHVLQNPEIYGLTKKPNIELIQRSWYMEGYHDRDFGKEPMWIIKTGEGGPKHELNPKYGQLLDEQQYYSKLNDLERAIHRGFLSAGIENVPFTIIKETAKDCLAHMPAEWSEEDEKMWMDIKSHMIHGSFIPFDKIEWIENRLKSLRPQPKQEWSEEDERIRQGLIEMYKNEQLVSIPIGVHAKDIIRFLENLRPSWKPSEDEERLINTSISFLKDFADKGYENAVECIDWLKSKLNGNSCE